MSPVAAAAPAFICRARPLPAWTTLALAPAASSAVLPRPQPQRIAAKKHGSAGHADDHQKLAASWYNGMYLSTLWPSTTMTSCAGGSSCSTPRTQLAICFSSFRACAGRAL